MKIDLQNKNREILFGELLSGDVFEYCGDYYIKITHDSEETWGVDLVSGVYYDFEDDTEVTTVNCVLKIN